jgi:hypothetical protein
LPFGFAACAIHQAHSLPEQWLIVPAKHNR